MRKLIYLVFNNGWVHASFTRHASFNPQWWRERNRTLLHEMGVAKIEFEEVPDNFRLPWEEA